MDETIAKGRHAWEVAREKLASGDYDLLILDELTYAVKYGWVDVAEVVAGLRDRAARTNVVVTGRDAPPEVIALADTVTEMVKVKHAYDAGHQGQEGHRVRPSSPPPLRFGLLLLASLDNRCSLGPPPHCGGTHAGVWRRLRCASALAPPRFARTSQCRLARRRTAAALPPASSAAASAALRTCSCSLRLGQSVLARPDRRTSARSPGVSAASAALRLAPPRFARTDPCSLPDRRTAASTHLGVSGGASVAASLARLAEASRTLVMRSGGRLP